ncbi:ly6/PLAUR domain-containing protein 6B-like isoform X2 [Neocloeon triangulifer]|nr:ly6/PLAUR domain-containing protein 6B-like isoform X2 [Neocloeon triangulifer]
MRPTLAQEAYSLFSLRVGLLLALLDSTSCVSTSSSFADSTIPPAQSNQTDSAGPYLAHQHQEKEPESVTCYTCVNVSDNLICNRFAIDRPCPSGEVFCHTLHIMDSHGGSVIVHKKCAGPKECSPATVGCLDIDSQRICVSCCDSMYCNEAVPTNHTNAVFSATATPQPPHQTSPSSAATAVASSVHNGGARTLFVGHRSFRVLLAAFSISFRVVL